MFTNFWIILHFFGALFFFTVFFVSHCYPFGTLPLSPPVDIHIPVPEEFEEYIDDSYNLVEFEIVGENGETFLSSEIA